MSAAPEIINVIVSIADTVVHLLTKLIANKMPPVTSVDLRDETAKGGFINSL